MRRAGRILGVLMCLSLLAAGLTMAGCVTSRSMKLDWVTRSGNRVYLGQGYLCWFNYAGGNASGLYVRDSAFSLGIGDGSSWHGVDLFGVSYVEIPLGVPTTAFLCIAGAALGARRWLATESSRRGRCQRCGYDLTGNVSGRCPECGKETGG